MATKTKHKGPIERVVESAADAVEEIGQAAVAFKDSWDHVRQAQTKARPAAGVARRAAKAVARGAKKATRTVIGKTTRRKVTGRKRSTASARRNSKR